ncbi:MAG: dehydrogenase [Luteitalea sp.]|nr:dehydrogenase [Luteitalea sp.]
MQKLPFLFFMLTFLGVGASALAQLGDGKRVQEQRSLVPADQIPPGTPLTPEEALQSFTLARGIKLEVAASEPLVQDPVAIAFGTDGRLWVVEMRGYMPDLDGGGEDAPIGRVVVLSDRDGDRRYDDSQVFLDDLVLPRAILLVDDGALVGAPPELAFWRDTDGDGKADHKVVVATDYGVRVDPRRPHLANPENAPNSLLWAHDNWIYSAHYTKKFRYARGEWETAATEFRGQWGLSQDDSGRLYHNGNSNQLRVDVIFADYLKRNRHYPALSGSHITAAADQWVWPARVTPGINRGYQPDMLREGRLKVFTAACAPWIYRGDLLPQLYGNAFVAEPAGNLVRRNVLIVEDGEVRSRNAYDRQEFIASTDERFRPVNFATGPDGALYIVDMYRGVLQHRISLTTYLRGQSEERELAHPQHWGRIYRVVPADKLAPRAARLAPLTTRQWVERLSHPNAWWRETAQRTLVERAEAAVVPAVRTIAVSGPEPQARVHALWTLAGMDAIDRSTVLAALQDPAPVVRVAGLRISEPFLKDRGRAKLRARALELTKDASPEVQLQAVLTLGEVGDPDVDVAVAEVVRAHPHNTFLGDAFYSGLFGRELGLLERLIAEPAWPNDPDANTVLSGLAQGVFGSRELPAIERILSLAAAMPPAAARRRAALIDGFMSAVPTTRSPLRFSKEPAGWADIKQHAADNERLAELDALMLWPDKPGVAVDAVATPLTPEEQARFDVGNTLFATCAACHHASGRGLDGLGPPLVDSEWVVGSPERLIRIVLHGLRGRIAVRGRSYTGDMPGFDTLDDDQLSSVLTYLRRAWGHTASPIDPSHVRAVRRATAARLDAWTSGELQRVETK